MCREFIVLIITDLFNKLLIYHKPPTISPGLILFRKRFLMGLYKGAYIRGGGLYMDDFLC
jgi:hypothetical protein